MNTPRPLISAGLLHRGIPQQEGYYWVRRSPTGVPVILRVAFQIPEGFYVVDEGLGVTWRADDWFFWGPITPPDDFTVHLSKEWNLPTGVSESQPTPSTSSTVPTVRGPLG